MTFERFLETSPIFTELTRQDITDFQRIMRVHHFPDDYEFFREGTRGHDVHLMIEGNVTIAHRKGSYFGPLKSRQLGSGDMFGLVAALCNQKHEISCYANGPVTVATMPDSSFRLLHTSNSNLGLHFQQLVIAQLSRDYRALVDMLRRELFHETGHETISASVLDSQPHSYKPETTEPA